MVNEWLLPQLNEDSPDCILQQDGTQPHYHNEVRQFLNLHLPQQWIGRGTIDNQMLLPWPPLSPDITPCDLFLWGYVPPFPATIPELRN